MFIMLIVLAISVVFGIIFFNSLIRQKMLMKEAWSGIDVQLKRRRDLIPNVVETVKGYMGYEKGLLKEVTEIRSKIDQAATVKEKGAQENNLSRTLKSIFALAEAYPDLKANNSFLGLQKNLAEIEDQIQLARRYYNGTARNYNIAVQSFPGNIVAGLFHFAPSEFFEIEYATERQVPDVKF